MRIFIPLDLVKVKRKFCCVDVQLLLKLSVTAFICFSFRQNNKREMAVEVKFLKFLKEIGIRFPTSAFWITGKPEIS